MTDSGPPPNGGNEPPPVAPGPEWASVTIDEGEYVAVGGEGRWFKRIAVVLVVVLLFAVASAGGALWWVRRQVDPPGDPGDPVALSVPDGATSSDIGDLLESRGVITDARLWRYWVSWQDRGPFQAGDYVLAESSSFGEAADVLDDGPALPEAERFTVPEGLWIPEILDQLLAELPRLDRRTLELALDDPSLRWSGMPAAATTLEGLLFPETYEVFEEADELAVLQRMAGEFEAVARSVDLEGAAVELGVTPYDLVIVASLIELEAKVPEDQDKISRVIHNRLANGTPIGIDATFIYHFQDRGRVLTVSDLEVDSPYNSRLNAGLPPTPIGAPGRGALHAAAHPAEGPWLWYVLADAEGHHFFTDDFDAFNAQKQKSQDEGLF
ncbi:MAG: endolytic transglycosylase MltG [Actinomycetia bacterium]|nr:endolytic transglycosylase MltG [Actinomycetes bacterium]